MITREELISALKKPVALADDIVSCDHFDPWGDVIKGIYGNYSSVMDDIFIEALEAVRDGKALEFSKLRGDMGELVLYVLAGHRLTEYGTSPRGGWVDEPFRDLWQPLIDKWKAYAKERWA